MTVKMKEYKYENGYMIKTELDNTFELCEFEKAFNKVKYGEYKGYTVYLFNTDTREKTILEKAEITIYE